MGGFVAFEVMRRAPGRVAKLALISTLASADGPAQTARRQGYIDLVESGTFGQVVEERIPILFPADKRGDARLLGIARRMAADTGAATFLAQQRARSEERRVAKESGSRWRFWRSPPNSKNKNKASKTTN